MEKTSAPNAMEAHEIKRQHRRLKEEHERALEDQRWWSKVLNDDRMKKAVKQLRDSADRNMERLVTCEKKEVDGLQAHVKVSREMVATFESKVDDVHVKTAADALQRFENENALFLSADGEAKAND